MTKKEQWERLPGQSERLEAREPSLRISISVFSAIGGAVGTSIAILTTFLMLGDRGIWFTRQEGAALDKRVTRTEAKLGIQSFMYPDTQARTVAVYSNPGHNR